MITAVDTNVLLDVFAADPEFGPRSAALLRRCLAEGGLVACEVVWAEIAASLPSPDRARRAMDGLGVAFDGLDQSTAMRAGEVWREYRRRGGARERVIADFLIGAHADRKADRLLSRDRGFYRTYFRSLRVLDPTAG